MNSLSLRKKPLIAKGNESNLQKEKEGIGSPAFFSSL